MFAVRHIGILLCLMAALAAPSHGMPLPREEAAGPVGPCTMAQLCSFDDPEDLADLIGTDWIIVGQAAQHDLSGLAAMHSVSGAIVHYRQADIGVDCLPGGRSGGLGVRRYGTGHRLAHILHATDGSADRVEIVDVHMRRGVPHLRRAACVAAPSPYFLNDIAPDTGGGFVATHMFDRSRPRPDVEADFRAGRPTGFVVRWSVKGGWSQVAGTDGTFPNGIDLTPDGRWIAFAEIYGHALNYVRIDGRDRRRVLLAMQPDNVTAVGGARFIVAGGIGKPMVSTRNCPALRRPGCGFPSRAIQVDFARGGRQTVLATSGGESVPGMSVALKKGRFLYLGTAFGDRITKIAALDRETRLP